MNADEMRAMMSGEADDRIYWMDRANHYHAELKRLKDKSRVTEETLLLNQQAVRDAKRRRRRGFLFPLGLVLCYLTLLFNHPLGLLLTIPVTIVGFLCFYLYADGTSTVPEAEDALERNHARYVNQMLEEPT